MTVSEFLARFDRATPTSGQQRVKCPGHDDRKASLAIKEGADGRVLLTFHAGCDPLRIVNAMSLALKDLFTERLSCGLAFVRVSSRLFESPTQCFR